MTYVKNHPFNVALVVGVVIAAALFFVSKASAQPSSVTVELQQTATTSVTYLTPGTATTTFQFDSQTFSSTAYKVPNMYSIDSGQMLISMTASSSVGNLSTLQWEFDCSNNNIDWYGESAALTAAGSVASESTSTIQHRWTPGTTATTTKWISIPICATQHERVVFSIPGNPGTNASSSAFYIEVGLKKNPSTP